MLVPGSATRPSYIQLPSALSATVDASSSSTVIPASPDPMFTTPPSSPLVESPLPHLNAGLHTQPDDLSSPNEIFPEKIDVPAEIDLDDGLNTLEKIYLFTRSPATFHRVFIAHALPEFLQSVSPQDAVQYVLPLLTTLALDEGS